MKTMPSSQGAGPRMTIHSLFFAWVLSSHAAEATDRVSVVQVPAAGQVVKAHTDASGTMHLLFDTEEGPQYANSPDSGVTFSTPLAIVDAPSRKPGLKFQGADLAVGKDGRVHVALSSNAWKLKLPEEEWSLFYASLASGRRRSPQ